MISTPPAKQELKRLIVSAATLSVLLFSSQGTAWSQGNERSTDSPRPDSSEIRSGHEHRGTQHKAGRRGFKRDTTARLNEVVVSASGFEQDKKDAPASITVISRTEIQSKRHNNLAELLSDVEGVDIGSTNGKTGGRTITMRGMPTDYTLILIDGRRQNAAGNVTPNGFGETSTGFLPSVEEIERVEVIRGPMATLYGSDAMGGVINIITRRVSRVWSANFSSDQTFHQQEGFGGSFSNSFGFSGPLYSNKLGFTGRGRIFNRKASSLRPSGEFDSTVTISTRGPSPVKSTAYSLGGRLSFRPVRSQDIYVDYELNKQVYDNTKGQLGTLDNPANPNGGYGPKQWYNRDQVSVVHNWRFGSSRLETAYTRNSTETIGRTIPPGTPGGLPGSGEPNKVPGSPRELNSANNLFDSKLVSAINRHMFTVGGQFWDAKMVDGIALSPFAHKQWSLFIEDEYRVIDQLAITVGLRRDDHNKFGGHFSPRAYAVWNASPMFTIKGGISQGFKTPRVDQLAEGIVGFTGQGTRPTIGSPHLKPETSTSSEVGIYFRHFSGFGANLTVFNNQFKDKIASGTPVPNCSFAANPNVPGCLDYGDFPAQEFFSQSVNIDKAVTRGGEVGIRTPLIARTSLSLNYTFTESEQQSGDNKGAPLVNTPKHMANGKLSTSITERLSSWVSGEYRGKRLRRTSSSANEAYDALGDYHAYQLFHIGGSFTVTKHFSINATMYNLANKDFLKYASYASPTVDDPSRIVYTSVYNIHEEGRRLWVSTNFKF